MELKSLIKKLNSFCCTRLQIKPGAAFKERQRTHLSILLLIFIGLSSLITALSHIFSPDTFIHSWQSLLVEFGFIFFLIIPLFLNCRGHFQKALLLTLTALTLAVFYGANVHSSQYTQPLLLLYLVVPIIVGCTFLSPMRGLLFSAAVICTLIGSAFFMSANGINIMVFHYAAILGLTAILVMATSHYRLRVVREQQAEIADSEGRFQSIAQNSPMGMHMYELTPSGRLKFVMANTASDVLLGVNHSDLLGKYLEDAFPYLKDTEIPQKYIKVARTNDIWWSERIEYDGEEIATALEVYAFQVAQDKMIATFWDVTHRKRTEIELRQKTEDITLLNAINEAVIRGDKMEDITDFLSREFRRIFSCGSVSVFLCSDDQAYLHRTNLAVSGKLLAGIDKSIGGKIPQGRICLTEGSAYLKILKAGDPFLTEDMRDIKSMIAEHASSEAAKRALSKVFESLNFKSMVSIPLVSRESVLGLMEATRQESFTKKEMMRFISMSAQIYTVLRRKQAEEALVESEEKFRNLAEKSPAMIFINKGGNIVYVNKACEDIMGYSKQEFYDPAFDFRKLISPEHLSVIDNNFYDHSHGREVEPFEYSMVGKRGHKINGIINTKIIAYEGAHAILGIITDITERKRAEEERVRLEQQLHQTRKMDAIGQLAGGIAHDFNNQLTGMAGYAEIIREKMAHDMEISKYADNILVAIKSSASLTSQLLAFARKGKYQEAVINIHSTIGEVVALLAHSIDKKISIHQGLHANPPTVFGDPGQLQNALLNLALNARDAMSGGGTLTFSTDIVSLSSSSDTMLNHGLQDGEYLTIVVADTGKGMDSDTIKHIFEPFFTTKPPGAGTGMGLAAAYGTVNNHKGALEVESEPGQGSTFTIYLPLCRQEQVRENSSDFKPAKISKARILLVEDEEMISRIASILLKGMGHEVEVAVNGRDAVDKFIDHGSYIDVIIMDMVMPEMSGSEAFLEMKKLNPKVKVVLTSGYTVDKEAQKILDAGAAGFLQKPYRKAQLSQVIEQALNTPS